MKDFFESVVGKENVSEEIGDKEVYCTDASGIQGKTRLIVWVEEVKQVHQIVLYAKRTKMNIVARGGGTNVVGSCVPNNSIVLDFTKMNKILERGEDYVVVEPGITVDKLNKELKDKEFPIIPGSSKVATVGGMVATNASGLENRHGSMKDWVLDVSMIDGTGKTRHLGDKEIEEICGSEGCFGLISEVKLRIIDKTERKSMDVLKFDDIESLIEKVFELNRDRDILAMHFMNARAAKLAGFSDINYIIVLYSGYKGNIKDNVRIKKIMDTLGSLHVYMDTYGYKIIQDPKLNLESIAEFLYWLKNNEIPCFGQIGAGMLKVCLKDLGKVKEMFLFIDKFNPEVTSGHGIGLLKKDFVKEMNKVKFIRLKKKYDPEMVLGKGKIV